MKPYTMHQCGYAFVRYLDNMTAIFRCNDDYEVYIAVPHGVSNGFTYAERNWDFLKPYDNPGDEWTPIDTHIVYNTYILLDSDTGDTLEVMLDENTGCFFTLDVTMNKIPIPRNKYTHFKMKVS